MQEQTELSPQEEHTPQEESQIEQPTELSEDDEMGAAFDRLTAEGIDDDAPDDEGAADRDEKGRFKKKAVEDGAKTDEAEQEEVAAASERPKYFPSLPKELRDHWDEMPAEAREAVSQSYMQMSAQSAAAGRMAKGLEPIRNVLAGAAKEFPELAQMTPDQVAADAMELAKTRVQLMRDPVNTLLAVAEQTGALQGLAARLTGQEMPQQSQTEHQLRGQIQQLEAKVQELSNPDIIRGSVEQFTNEQRVLGEVQTWAAEKEHYQAVEPILPSFIQAAQNALPQASSMDLLDAAYNMATEAMGLRTTAQVETPPAPAPQKTRRILDAKSVNIASQGSKQTPMSEEEAMAAAWDRAMRG